MADTMNAHPASAAEPMTRRLAAGGIALAIPALAAVGYAAFTGRIDLLSPALPDKGDLFAVPGAMFRGAPVPPITRAAFGEGLTILNIWASWCPYCQSEHSHLMRLSERPDVRLFGLVTDDTEHKAADYLRRTGNPYMRLSVDHERVYMRALMQRGVPSTYVFRADGGFVAKVPGALDATNIAGKILPALAG